MLRFSLALLCLSLLALAEDEKAPSSVVLDEKNFKEKVGDEGRYSGNNLVNIQILRWRRALHL